MLGDFCEEFIWNVNKATEPLRLTIQWVSVCTKIFNMYICSYLHIYLHMYICTCRTCLLAYTHPWLPTYVCTYVLYCMYVRMYVGMYICTCTQWVVTCLTQVLMLTILLKSLSPLPYLLIHTYIRFVWLFTLFLPVCRGRVIGPTFRFNVPLIDFKVISYGERLKPICTYIRMCTRAYVRTYAYRHAYIRKYGNHLVCKG